MSCATGSRVPLLTFRPLAGLPKRPGALVVTTFPAGTFDRMRLLFKVEPRIGRFSCSGRGLRPNFDRFGASGIFSLNACEGIFDHFSLILIVARCLMFRD
jgi:hypothetical protein